MNRRPDIPVISEAQLQEEKWTCAACHSKTFGPECKSCGAPRQDALIVVPEGECGDEIMERITTDKRCGRCVHFDWRSGQERLADPHDAVFARMVHEMEVRSIATNVNWKEIGLCRQWTGGPHDLMITCSSSPARCARKHVDSSIAYKQKDHNVPCPAYEPLSSSDGRQIRSYRQVKGSRTVGTD